MIHTPHKRHAFNSLVLITDSAGAAPGTKFKGPRLAVEALIHGCNSICVIRLRAFTTNAP